MDTQDCLKSFLLSWVNIQIECLLRTVSVANCPQCLRAIQLDNTHSCFRIRTGLMKYEKHHLIFHSTSARSCLLNFITFQPFLYDLQNLLYIQLKNHNHPEDEISMCNTADQLVDVARSYEAMDWLWVNYPVPVNDSLSTSAQATGLRLPTVPSTTNQTPLRTVDEDGEVSPAPVTCASDEQQHGQATIHNKICHRDRKARLKAPCSSHKNFNTDAAANANAIADADAGGSTIALPRLPSGELKTAF